MDTIDQTERFKGILIRQAESEIAMAAPERLRNPCLASLTALQNSISALKGKGANDPNIIMESLPHLRMESGWRLAIRINGDSFAQFSTFYAHNPLRGLKKVAGAFVGVDVEDDESVGLENVLLNPCAETNLFKHVRLDGSAESFWEAALLKFASSQYYLGWHANYTQKRIVTSVETFPSEISGMSEINEQEVYGLLDKWVDYYSLQRCNEMLMPKAILKDEGAEVSFAFFTPFGGLGVFRMGCKRDPFSIVDNSRISGFHYHCGMMY